MMHGWWVQVQHGRVCRACGPLFRFERSTLTGDAVDVRYPRSTLTALSRHNAEVSDTNVKYGRSESL